MLGSTKHYQLHATQGFSTTPRDLIARGSLKDLPWDNICCVPKDYVSLCWGYHKLSKGYCRLLRGHTNYLRAIIGYLRGYEGLFKFYVGYLTRGYVDYLRIIISHFKGYVNYLKGYVGYLRVIVIYPRVMLVTQGLCKTT